MQINRIKLIADLLHIRLRSSVFVQLLFVLTSEAQTVLNSFRMKVPNWLYQINADASVISLQHQIKRELDVDAIITELSGQPVDFLVTVNGFVDENRLGALIESRKLAGKSFVYKTGGMEYECDWSNFVCVQTYVDNYVQAVKLIGGTMSDVVVVVDLLPTSPLRIIMYVYSTGTSDPYRFEMTINIDQWVQSEDHDNKYAFLFVAAVEVDDGVFIYINVDHVVVASITPSKDYTYKYLENNS